MRMAPRSGQWPRISGWRPPSLTRRPQHLHPGPPTASRTGPTSSYPETSYRDAWGRSLNPISFILLEDTTATAHYLPATRDTDADGLPDWFEIEYFGDLTRPASDDSDGDGISLLAEYTGGTHPLYGNSHLEGGVATGLIPRWSR